MWKATTGAHCAPLQICRILQNSRTGNGRPYRITSHPLARKSKFLWNAEGGVPYKVFPYIIKAKPTMSAHCAPLQICRILQNSRTGNGRPYRITSHPLARKSKFLWNAEGGVPYKVFPYIIKAKPTMSARCAPLQNVTWIELSRIASESDIWWCVERRGRRSLQYCKPSTGG